VAQLKQAAFRVDDALLERLDRMVEVMQRSPDFEGMEVSRSTAIRALVLRGLAAFEMRLGVTRDLPKDYSLATEAYWNRREQEAEQELEAIRRFIDEYQKEYWSAALDVTSSYEDPPKPRSKFYQDRAKKP
jgi:predicted transcriptional regulator